MSLSNPPFVGQKKVSAKRSFEAALGGGERSDGNEPVRRKKAMNPSITKGEETVDIRTRELMLKSARALRSQDSPTVKISPTSQRRRPRGSEGGKSIHKAAEAPTFDAPSPATSSFRKSSRFKDFYSDNQLRGRIGGARKRYFEVTRTPSPCSSSSPEETMSVTDSMTPELQMAPITPKSQSSHSYRAVAKKTASKGQAKANTISDSQSASLPESYGLDSDNDIISDFGYESSSSYMPSPREILSQIGKSKTKGVPPGSPGSPTRSILKHKSENPTANALTQGLTDINEPRPSSPQLPPTSPQAIMDAFETLNINVVNPQRIKRLPFISRNVRASFQKKCRQLNALPDNNQLPNDTEILYTYRYTPRSGTQCTHQLTRGRRECPLCPIFSRFPSWQAMTKHMAWAHDGIHFAVKEIKSSNGNLIPNVIVHLKEDGIYEDYSLSEGGMSEHQTIAVMQPKGPSTRVEKTLVAGINYDIKTGARHTPTTENSSTSRSSPHPSSSSNKVGSSNDATNSSGVHTPEVMGDPGDIGRPSGSSIRSAGGLSSSLPLPLPTPDSHPPIVPPLNNLHGPAMPIPKPGESSSTGRAPKTYRPTGPHLFDHLSSLPLDAFGNRSWFVLDKEEEIFELTDVLDEDKVICALWGRWILLNRSFFVANYLAGVEAFVDEYWSVIHQAAGWGALRAWLLVLVSRRLLKNIEMVQVLKKYNALVGKDRWPKAAISK